MSKHACYASYLQCNTLRMQMETKEEHCFPQLRGVSIGLCSRRGILEHHIGYMELHMMTVVIKGIEEIGPVSIDEASWRYIQIVR